MPRSFQSIEQNATSEAMLGQFITKSSMVSKVADGHAGPDYIKTQQPACGDVFDPLEDSKSPQSAKLSISSIESTLTQPLQVRLSEKQPHLHADLIDERDVAAAQDTKSYGVQTPSFSSKKTTRWQRIQQSWLHWCSAYRILIGLIFIINATVLIVLLSVNASNTHFSLSGSLIATAGNLFAAVLVRQEDVINTTFSFVAKTPARLPLAVRKIIADFHHYGGVHIGCSLSALLWYFPFVVLNTEFFIDQHKEGKASGWMWADIITCYAFLLSILVVCITAHPRLRVKFHNTFEHTHRFGGWTALFVLWLNAGVSSHSSDSEPMYANAAVWLLAAITFLIILPWTRIRRVPITATPISGREIKLTFPFKNMPYTSTARFSQNPLMEWHAFATVPAPDHETAYIVISQAGDWTRAMIQNPPSHMWMRRPAAKNFLTFAPLFDSLLLVATGAGIGPLLSLLCSPPIAHMKAQGKQIRVMWTVHNPDAEHWRFVRDIIGNVDSMPSIFDSRLGRPDLVFETLYMKRVCGLEAVMVVSHASLTRDVVEGVKAEGGAAYGAVFDS